jgi:dTDP-4-dehydrorhamnose 3,5-epimerase
MKFTATTVQDTFVVELSPHSDDRGFFARAFDAETFRAQGLADTYVQANLARTLEAGTIRGLHYQHEPHGEAKLIRCVTGALFQVAVDLRPDSPTRYRWAGVELTAENRVALYIPPGCAAGAQALLPESEAFYLVSTAYDPQAEDGVRYDDPQIGIEWPQDVTRISKKDLAWPLLGAEERP